MKDMKVLVLHHEMIDQAYKKGKELSKFQGKGCKCANQVGYPGHGQWMVAWATHYIVPFTAYLPKHSKRQEITIAAQTA